MNFDCLELVLRHCDTESLVAASQTCNTLRQVATRLFRRCNLKYISFIHSKEEEDRTKRTISSVGNHFKELILSAMEFRIEFYDRVPQKCPNLRRLDLCGIFEPNDMLNSIRTLHQLEVLHIYGVNPYYIDDDMVDAEAVIGIARELKHLTWVTMYGVEFHDDDVMSFLVEANSLTRFGCAVKNGKFEADITFLKEFRENDEPRDLLIDEIIKQVSQNIIIKIHNQTNLNKYKFQIHPIDSDD